MTLCLSVYFRHIVWGAELPVGMSVLVIPQEQFACHSTMHLGSWKSIFQRTLGCISLSPFVRRENRRISTLASSTVCRDSHLYDSYNSKKKKKNLKQKSVDVMKTQCSASSRCGAFTKITLSRSSTQIDFCTHAG